MTALHVLATWLVHEIAEAIAAMPDHVLALWVSFAIVAILGTVAVLIPVSAGRMEGRGR